MNNANYITSSLELHLFFLRIMKEHALFLEAGFTPANSDFTREAEQFKNEFQDILAMVVNLSCGVVSPAVLNSGEAFTQFTLSAEQKTQHLTSIQINTNITEQEYQLGNCAMPYQNGNLMNQVAQINRSILMLLNQFIQFKETILTNVRSCAMFTMNYPLLIEHILREAKLYREYLTNYENGNFNVQSMKQTEQFWNQIMMEHALFIRGLLDPTEGELIKASNDFANGYKELLECAFTRNNLVIADAKCNPYNETVKFKEFKTAGTEGILNCKIQSIIVPLLADHVLREANHYLRLLSQQ